MIQTVSWHFWIDRYSIKLETGTGNVKQSHKMCAHTNAAKLKMLFAFAVSFVFSIHHCRV